MTIASILVAVDLEPSARERLRLAGHLVERRRCRIEVLPQLGGLARGDRAVEFVPCVRQLCIELAPR